MLAQPIALFSVKWSRAKAYVRSRSAPCRHPFACEGTEHWRKSGDGPLWAPGSHGPRDQLLSLSLLYTQPLGQASENSNLPALALPRSTWGKDCPQGTTGSLCSLLCISPYCQAGRQPCSPSCDCGALFRSHHPGLPQSPSPSPAGVLRKLPFMVTSRRTAERSPQQCQLQGSILPHPSALLVASLPSQPFCSVR